MIVNIIRVSVLLSRFNSVLLHNSFELDDRSEHQLFDSLPFSIFFLLSFSPGFENNNNNNEIYKQRSLKYKQLCCRKQAVRCFVSVSSQLQQYKTSSSLLLLRRLQIYHCVQLNTLFCCLWHNVEASCHKHFVVFFSNQHRRLLPAMCHNSRYGGRGPRRPCLQHLPVAALTAARYRLRITISAYPTCIRPPIWYGKTRMVWLPDGEKFRRYLYSFLTECTNVTDRRTHTRTDTA